MNIETFSVIHLWPDHITSAIAVDISELTSQLCGKHKVLSVADIQRMAATHHLLAAVTPGEPPRVIGMACLVLMDLPQGRRTLIESVVVHENHRQQGIARALLQTIAREATRQDAAPLSLTCNPRRPEARRLYERLGFAVAETSVYRACPDAVAEHT